MGGRYGSALTALLVAAALSGCSSEEAVAPPPAQVAGEQPSAAPVASAPAGEESAAEESAVEESAVEGSGQPSPPAEPADPAAPSSQASAGGTALAQLATLAVKGRAPMTGYDRDRYGQAWADVDRNGCDTRNDMLRRDLRALVVKPGTRDCVIASGLLAPDPYTGTNIAFERGGANEVDIDHVVALANSWATGAQFWNEPKRIAFGNDPANLLAVDSSANRQKGAGDAATWLPAQKSYRCTYVARQVAVKAKYDLWITAAERDAISRVLGDCPDQSAFDAGKLVVPPPGRGAVSTPAPAPKPDPKPAPQAATDPRFPYCKDAIAAGYGPYVSGKDPEYAWYRDADGDGTVCE
ncbi:MAG: GmrSD restriction endonuclease domain-containing protein [Sporichthyaceae bacterium]